MSIIKYGKQKKDQQVQKLDYERKLDYGEKKETGEDPVGVDSGYERICRGGHYSGRSDFCLVFYRRGHLPTDRVTYVGFRVVRSAVN